MAIVALRSGSFRAATQPHSGRAMYSEVSAVNPGVFILNIPSLLFLRYSRPHGGENYTRLQAFGKRWRSTSTGRDARCRCCRASGGACQGAWRGQQLSDSGTEPDTHRPGGPAGELTPECRHHLTGLDDL
jgi:hypothetical protein